jgi:predicted RNA binding protein YcfA (HicA-like mRNA interferase family)
MPKLPVISGKTLLKRLLKNQNYKLSHQHGSHSIIKDTTNGKKTTIPIHANKDLPKGTLKAIITDLSLSTQEFVSLTEKNK